MLTTVTVEVGYSQLAVFESQIANPFNDWSERHVAQGFAWRPGSVSFRSLVESGRHTVQIHVVDIAPPIDPEAVRAVEVPFNVPENGEIEVGSILETVTLAVKGGSYLMRCEFLLPAHGECDRVRLILVRKTPSRFAVVRADSELSLFGDFQTTANGAI